MADTMDEVYAEDLGFFLEDLQKLAKHYITLFFRDKQGKDGQRLTPGILHDPRNISMVLDQNVCDGMDRIYGLIGANSSEQQRRGWERTGQLPGDIKYVLSLISACAKCGIPKHFSTGIIIMYLELCDGLRLAA